MSSVQVAVRARPLSDRERDSDTPFCIEMRGKATVLYKSGRRSERSGCISAKEFVFDHSYWSVNNDDDNFVGQETIFKDLGVPVLDSAFQGYNVCVFAYGQTGSGKTYTMMGSEGSLGLIPRICEGLFSWMDKEKLENKENVSYRNEVSYMEIYNEKVRDLLCLATDKDQQLHSLRVREHPREGPYVEDLSKHAVNDYNAISKLIDLGNSRRVTASTRMNVASSRSHTIFTIKFTQAKYTCSLPSETISKIHLVDLAGSERASATGTEGERLKEGGNINRSLVCLGTVISTLADMSNQNNSQAGGGGKRPFIPYRDSVLTWLLKDSLGGNSKTIMIATISPAKSSYGETLSTLRYSSRAKNIVNEPTVNEDQNVKVIRDLRAEIKRLKEVILTSGRMDPFPDDKQRLQQSTCISLAEDIYKKEEQVVELTRKWAGKWTDIRRIVEEHHLALRSEGVKMVVDSMRPHFVGVDPDILSTGLVFYYLKDGLTTIGAKNDSCSPPDISVVGIDIDEEHCQVECKGHDVILHPLSGNCFINHKKVKRSFKLSQGDLLQLGESSVFRFNHPHEAQKLRKKHSEDLLVRCPDTKVHTLPRTRRKKRMMSPESNSHYLIDKVGSASPTFTSCTMTVELESRAMVAARTKKQEQTNLSMRLSQGSCENEAEFLFSPSSLSDTSHSSNLFSSSSTSPNVDRSASYTTQDMVSPSSDVSPVISKESSPGPLSSLVVWLAAPLLLCLVSLLTSPLFIILGFLLFIMRMFGLSNRCWLVRWLSVPLAICTTIMMLPMATVSELLFRRTLNFLVFIHSYRRITGYIHKQTA